MDLTIKDIKPKHQPSPVTIHFKTEDEMLLFLNRIIHISSRLLYWTNQFDTNYGKRNSEGKHRWQNAMAQHLATKNIPITENLSKLKIIISNE